MFFNQKSTPSQVNSATVYLNNRAVASSNRDGDKVSLSYNMSPKQEETYNFTEDEVLEIFPKLNTFLPDTLNAFSKELEAYQKAGLKTINNAYKNSETSLKNDIASRFGNLDNSSFLESLKKIKEDKSAAVAELGEKVSAKNSELFDDELKRRYNYLNALLNYQNAQFQNAMSALGLTQNSLKLNSNITNPDYSAYGNAIGSLLANALMSIL